MTALVVALAVVVALLAVLVVGLLRSHAEILRALHDLGGSTDPAHRHTTARAAAVASATPPEIRTVEGVPEPRIDGGLEAVDLSGNTPDGGVARVAVTGVANSTLLAFLSTGCHTCADFWRAFATPGEIRLPGVDTRLVVVTRGPHEESMSAVDELAPPGVTTLMSSEAWTDYSVPVSPYFLLVDGASGTVVGEGAAASWDQVSALLDRAVADAGLNPEGRTRRDFLRGNREREDRADRELAEAGIQPGHPSLYPSPAGPEKPEDG